MKALSLVLLLAACGAPPPPESSKLAYSGHVEPAVPTAPVVCERTPLPEGMRDGVFEGWAWFGQCIPSLDGTYGINDPAGDGKDAFVARCVCCPDDGLITCGWSWANPS